jgi:hypothetical protein
MLTINRHGARLLCLTALVSVGVALGACGGDDKPQASAAPGTPERPVVGKLEAETQSGRQNESTQEAAKAGKAGKAAAAADDAPNYGKLLQRQTKKPRSTFTPCNLVSPSQARAILGGEIQAPLEAPQGPTCIYRTKSGSSFVTVAVQSLKLEQASKRLRDRRMVSVSERPAYCGVYGQPMLYAELPGGRVLTIGARCGVARKFAARAVKAYDHTTS